MAPLIAFASIFVFSGGTDSDLGAALQKELAEPCIAICLDKLEDHKSVEIEYEDRDYVIRRIGALMGRIPATKAGTAWSTGAWPTSHLIPGISSGISGTDFNPDGSLKRKPDYEPVPLSRFISEKGLFRVQMKGRESVRLGSLKSLSPSKPVRVHWFFEALPISINAKDASPAEMLHAVALAAGAKFRDDPAEFAFDFWPEEFRRRALKTYERKAATEESETLRLRYEFGYEVLKVVSAKNLSEIYSKRDGVKQFALPETPRFLQLVRARLRAGSEERREKMRREVDLSKPVMVEMSANGSILTVVQTRNGPSIAF